MKADFQEPIILDGKSLSLKKEATQLIRSRNFAQAKGRKPSLAVILVGNDPASKIYVNNKIKKCEKVEITSHSYTLPENVAQQQLEDLITQLNQDSSIDGILLQVPLPKHLNSQLLLDSISAEKDVDGFHPLNQGFLSLNQNNHPICCTPAGVIEILDNYRFEYKGANALVIGASNTVGKPMGILLINRYATVQICNSHTQDLAHKVRQADLVISATGQANLVQADWIKPGSWIIDIGISRDAKGRICGDVNSQAYHKSSHYTPVPGGVGPMTIAKLIDNCLTLAFNQANLQG